MKTVQVHSIVWPGQSNLPQGITLEMDDDMDPNKVLPEIFQENFGCKPATFKVQVEQKDGKVKGGQRLPSEDSQ